MTAFTAVCLAAAVLGFGGDDAEKPDPWQKTYDAASRAEKEGKPEVAIEMLEGVVTEAEKFGPEDLRLAKPLEALGLMYSTVPGRRYDEAESLLKRALAIREKAQGSEHPDVAELLVAIAMIDIIHRRFTSRATLEMLQHALKISETSKGPDSPEVAKVLLAIALAHGIKREFDEAELSYMRALAIHQKAFGPKSEQVADTLETMGSLNNVRAIMDRSLLAQAFIGPWKETKSDIHANQALSCYTQALAIREAAAMPDDPDLAKTLVHLGEIQIRRGEYEDAETYLTRWLTLDNVSKKPLDKTRVKVLKLLSHAAWKRRDWAASRDWDSAAKELRIQIAAQKTAYPSVQPAGFQPPAVPGPPATETDQR